MNFRKISTATLFVAALMVPMVMGAVPLYVPTPAGVVSLGPVEAEARARNTAANRLRNLTVPTAGTNLAQRFVPNNNNYRINLHQDRGRVTLQPARNGNQAVRHRIDTMQPNGTWNNGRWSGWRTGARANNRINVDVNRAQERRLQIAVRDRNRNIRTYTVRIGRACNNTWANSIRANAGSFNRSFNRAVDAYTLNIPHDRASVILTMGAERPRALVSSRTGTTAAWPAGNQGTHSRTVSVAQGGSATVQFRVRGAFSAAAPSPTHDRIYTVTVNRARPPAVGNPDGLLTVMDQSGPPLPTNPFRFVRYRGTLELTAVGNQLRLVNELPMQHYLFGVVPREIPTSAGVRTAVEAQAIAARSFALNSTIGPGRPVTNGVSSTVSFQVYGGHSRFANEANWRAGSVVTNLENPVSNTAVNSTGNSIILDSAGNIARAFYSACNGDRTANSEDVWVSRVSHLRSVADPFCGRSGHAGHTWSVTMTGTEVANAIRRGGALPAGATFATRITTVRANGWNRSMTVTWNNGTSTTISNADNVRIRLGTRSSNFSIATPGTRNLASSQFVFNGTGWGHGLGKSQNGAMQQAREGRSAAQILHHYFTDISIASRAPAGNMRINLDRGSNNRASWTIAPANGTTGAVMIINGQTFNGANGPYTFTVVGGNIRMTSTVTGAVVNFGNSIRITANPLPVAATEPIAAVEPLTLSIPTTETIEGFELLDLDETLETLSQGRNMNLFQLQELRNDCDDHDGH